jgi:putative oxidoreductase
MTTRAGTETDTRAEGRTSRADAAILFIRVIIGGLFIGHGIGKLFGWFGQAGINGTAAFFQSLGYEPAHQLAIFAGVAETVAGVLLVLGLLVPLAAGGIIGDMANAAWVKSPHGFWISGNGFEYEFFVIVTMLALTVAGAGAFAIDRNRNWFGNRTGAVVVAVVLGAITGAVFAFLRK